MGIDRGIEGMEPHFSAAWRDILGFLHVWLSVNTFGALDTNKETGFPEVNSQELKRKALPSVDNT
jgi:hypothetical protein